MINSQQQKIVSLSKNMLFSRELLNKYYYSEVLSEYAKKKKKNWGFEKKKWNL